MNQTCETFSEALCPLCHGSNSCGNLSPDTSSSCWCRDPEISFPKALLEQVPVALRGKACICQACVKQYLSQQSE
ncbi:MAG TPA: hypothetical protein ENI26_06180 [Methylophaga aminisulfidivorans]|uniref:Cysteine-rich CWC family protein n=1 Tax=Methylophaga aminisulfidivorans TaxID=230105 RepID=A0A7C1ZR10_9GAMM|nr:hypothetical protein [Methylophaga aminisulfidivorans]